MNIWKKFFYIFYIFWTTENKQRYDMKLISISFNIFSCLLIGLPILNNMVLDPISSFFVLPF